MLCWACMQYFRSVVFRLLAETHIHTPRICPQFFPQLVAALSSLPRVTRLLPPFPWHLPVPQLSAGLSPCRHVASALSQQGSVCGALSAVSFLWCWMTWGPAVSTAAIIYRSLLLSCQSIHIVPWCSRGLASPYLCHLSSDRSSNLLAAGMRVLISLILGKHFSVSHWKELAPVQL